MSCNDCKKRGLPCGCNDTAIPTPPPCQGEGCEDPNPCGETFDAQCIIYTGDDILCGTEVLVTAGDSMADFMVAIASLACSGGASSIHRISPDADAQLLGVDDQVISIDRNNCNEQVVITAGAGAPAGLLYNYVNELGVFVNDQPSIIMHPSQSTILFNVSTVAAVPGVYNFNYEATACGSTVLIPTTITVT